jgi:hypothetical protein
MSDLTQMPKQVNDIEPTYVTVFRAAAAERKLDLSVYNLKYFEAEKSYIVSASYKDKPPRMKGSDPKHPDCSAEIEKGTKRLMRFWYGR